jgi:rhodanese-related sulfurtransferase
MKKQIVLSIVMALVIAGFAQTQPSALIKNVTPIQFQKALDSLHDEVVIDLRTSDELKTGKIANAVQIDFFGAEFEPAIANLDKDKVYLLYCGSGGRSGETVEIMNRMGFKTIYNLEGGFRGWVKQKMPVAK